MPTEVIREVLWSLYAVLPKIGRNGFEGYFPSDDLSEREWSRVVGDVIDAMSDSVHISDGFFYAPKMGNPSGNPLTVTINSLVNALYATVAMMDVCDEEGLNYKAHQTRTDRFRLACYGDDTIVGIPQFCEDFLTYSRMEKALNAYGIAIQPPTKNGEIEEQQDISTVTFLKRGFEKHVLGCAAVMSEEDILAPLCWTKNGDLFLSAVDSALREYHLRGVEDFRVARAEFCRLLTQVGIDPNLATEHEIRRDGLVLAAEGFPMWGDVNEAMRVKFDEMTRERVGL
jgi:hypothetical protein